MDDNNIGQQIRQQDDLPTLRSVMLQCISAEHNYTFICRSAAFIVEINHDLRLGRKVGKIFIEMIQSGGSAILQAKLTLDHFPRFWGRIKVGSNSICAHVFLSTSDGPTQLVLLQNAFVEVSDF